MAYYQSHLNVKYERNFTLGNYSTGINVMKEILEHIIVEGDESVNLAIKKKAQDILNPQELPYNIEGILGKANVSLSFSKDEKAIHDGVLKVDIDLKSPDMNSFVDISRIVSPITSYQNGKVDPVSSQWSLEGTYEGMMPGKQWDFRNASKQNIAQKLQEYLQVHGFGKSNISTDYVDETETIIGKDGFNYTISFIPTLDLKNTRIKLQVSASRPTSKVLHDAASLVGRVIAFEETMKESYNQDPLEKQVNHHLYKSIMNQR